MSGRVWKLAVFAVYVLAFAGMGASQSASDLVLDANADPVANIPGDMLVRGDINLSGHVLSNVGGLADCTASEVLFGDGSCGTAGGGGANGSDGQLQYNAGGTLGGASSLVYDDSTGRLAVNRNTASFDLHVNGTAQVRDNFEIYMPNGGVPLEIKNEEGSHPWNYIEWESTTGRQWWTGMTSGGDWAIGRHNAPGRVEVRSSNFVVPSGNIGIRRSPGNRLDIDVGSSYSHGISLDGQTALSARNGNEWLRLNQDQHFANGVYTPGLLRADGGLYFSGSRRLDDAGGNYGTVSVLGGGKNGWEGYSINNRFNFMSDDGNTVGIYDDTENNWIWLFEDNSYVRMYAPDGSGYIYLDNGANLQMRNRRVRGLASPSAGSDAATKSYVDNNAGTSCTGVLASATSSQQGAKIAFNVPSVCSDSNGCRIFLAAVLDSPERAHSAVENYRDTPWHATNSWTAGGDGGSYGSRGRAGINGDSNAETIAFNDYGNWAVCRLYDDYSGTETSASQWTFSHDDDRAGCEVWACG